MHCDNYRTQIDRAGADLRAAQTAHTGAVGAVARQTDRLAATRDAADIVQRVGFLVQQEAHTAIAAVVTRCLRAVFPEPYEFEIQFVERRGRTEAEMVFLRDGEAHHPLDSSGGGVVDVAAFGLRLACLMLARPQRRRLVVLDEPFKFLSQGHRAAVRGLVEDLAAELGVQFVIVTHIDELHAGKIFEII
jgi:energy-coupling factor transporter ATP-binding protein EcfA2